MKTIELFCTGCNKTFVKELKEVTRQRKNGNYNFYCNRKCFGISHTKLIRSEYRFCDYCNNIFLTDYTTDTRHCSRGCASINSVTDYRRQRASECGGNNYENISSIEVRAKGLRNREMWKYKVIEEILMDRKINHIFEFPLERFVFDLALMKSKCFIEFDSKYHNGSRQTITDKEKEQLAGLFNWKVIRIATDTNNVIPGNVILPYI